MDMEINGVSFTKADCMNILGFMDRVKDINGIQENTIYFQLIAKLQAEVNRISVEEQKQQAQQQEENKEPQSE